MPSSSVPTQVVEVDEFERTASGLLFHAGDRELRFQLSSRTGVVFRAVDDRCRVRLTFGRHALGADVSVQPGAVVAVVDEEARAARADRNVWRRDMARVLLEWSTRLDASVDYADDLCAVVGAVTHPLLAELYARGAEPLSDIPRWAAPVFSVLSARDAAEVICAAPTRRLIRALVASLEPVEGLIDLCPLALVIAAGRNRSADVLANLLEAGTPGYPVRMVPTVDDVAVIARVLRDQPDDRVGLLLIDAMEDAPRLVRELRLLDSRRAQLPDLLPMRLDDLSTLRGRFVPALADPVTPQPQRQRQRREEPLPAPRAPLATSHHWPVPIELSPLDGARLNGLRLVVPTSAVQLADWGSRLRNCLADYRNALATGRTWVIGVEVNGVLAGAIEVSPRTRRLRQAFGTANTRLPREVRREALVLLRGHGVIT